MANAAAESSLTDSEAESTLASNASNASDVSRQTWVKQTRLQFCRREQYPETLGQQLVRDDGSLNQR